MDQLMSFRLSLSGSVVSEANGRFVVMEFSHAAEI